MSVLSIDRSTWWKVPVLVIVALRVFDGVIWLTGAAGKPPPDWGWFPEWLEKEAEYTQVPGYAWFLETVVIPNLAFFGWMQFLTEIALGLALVFGVLVPVTGVLATLWAFNIALGSWHVPGEIWYGLVLFVLTPLLVAVTRSGRAWGFDAYLKPRLEAHANARVRWLGKWL